MIQNAGSDNNGSDRTDNRVIDVAGHIWESDAVWEQHLDPAFMDRRPRVVLDEHYEKRPHEMPEITKPPSARVAAAPPP